jgi:hypothetical protein
LVQSGLIFFVNVLHRAGRLEDTGNFNKDFMRNEKIEFQCPYGIVVDEDDNTV